MSSSVNKVILIGNLGQNPEINNSRDGKKIANLSIATSESWKDKSGERQERTQWHRVVIFNEAIADIAERYLKKGSKVYIEGQIETRQWEKDGTKHYTTEIILRPYRGSLTMLETRGRDTPPPADDPDAYGTQAARSNTPPAHDEFADEIPF